MENSFCIVAHIPTSFILHRLHFSFSWPLFSLALRPSVNQFSVADRTSLRDPSFPLFPKSSLLCCQTGFSEEHVAAICFNNRPLRSYFYTHTHKAWILAGYLRDSTCNFSPIILLFFHCLLEVINSQLRDCIKIISPGDGGQKGVFVFCFLS